MAIVKADSRLNLVSRKLRRSGTGTVSYDDICKTYGGETPPNICRQKHGHTKKESSITKQNMKSTSGNHAIAIYMQFTQDIQLMQFAICVLVIKTGTNVFRQFHSHSPTFFIL